MKRNVLSTIIPPPPGVTPNVGHPEYIGHVVITLNLVFFPLSTLILFLRIYTRRVIVRIIGCEDCKHLENELEWRVKLTVYTRCNHYRMGKYKAFFRNVKAK